MQNLRMGGAEQVLVTYLLNFDRSKYEVELVLHTREGVLLNKLPTDIEVKSLVPVDNGKMLNKMYRSFFFKILKYAPFLIDIYFCLRFKKKDVNVGFMEGITTNLVSHFKGKKVAWVHTDVQKNPWADQYFSSLKNEQKVYGGFAKIVFVSFGTMQKFQEKFQLVSKKLEVIIHNPIDKDGILKKSVVHDLSFNKWFKATENTFRVISVGRLDPVKRYDLLINAFNDVQVNSELISLTIIGSGGEWEKLQKLKEQKNVKNLWMIGQKGNPMPYVVNSSLFVSTSLVESFPTAIIESLVLGTPVLATQNLGTSEVLKNVSSRNVSVLETSVNEKKLGVKIENLMSKLNKTNTTEVSNLFSMDEILKQYENLFEEVVKDV